MKFSSLIFTGSLLLALSSCGNNDNTDDGLNGPTTDTATGVDNTSTNQNSTMPMGDSAGGSGSAGSGTTNGTGTNNGTNGSTNNGGTNGSNSGRSDTATMQRR